MIVFGSQTFVKAKHIKKLDELSNIIDTLDKSAQEEIQPSQEIKQKTSEFLLETIPDWIRISICFENYMKAILLVNGFLIHKIDKISLKTMANNQNKKPISLFEFNQFYNYSVEIDSRRWILEGLKPQTIDFSVLLRKKYQDVIQLPEKILGLIYEINSKRNNLHFYHEAKNSYSFDFIEDLRLMEKFVKEHMMNLVSNLELELNRHRQKNEL